MWDVAGTIDRVTCSCSRSFLHPTSWTQGISVVYLALPCLTFHLPSSLFCTHTLPSSSCMPALRFLYFIHPTLPPPAAESFLHRPTPTRRAGSFALNRHGRLPVGLFPSLLGSRRLLLFGLGLRVPVVPTSSICIEFWTIRSGRNTAAHGANAKVPTRGRLWWFTDTAQRLHVGKGRTTMRGRAVRVALRLSVPPRPLPFSSQTTVRKTSSTLPGMGVSKNASWPREFS